MSTENTDATAITEVSSLSALDIVTLSDPGLVAVVSAYVSNHTVPVSELGTLISTVKTGLGLDAAAPEAAPEEEPVRKLTPKEIKAAVQPDSILCFENDKRYKTLRRVLASFNLTPEEYRAKWGLPADHPITAPNYAEQRRRIAIEKGFGHRKAPKQAAAA